ncbi:uncharacterized protein LOC110735574 [Chenopodium quinoa]|uniref:uncharacterized protein LOC110735574 n=1 Tax=Chenopodium quinoa TaxID=63459 RepID=UPI000B78F9EF|nr:uncharacterized protein LOC110735574 [Chenopodium quinoa]
MVRDICGLYETRNTCLEEIVAGFLYTLAHHKKNRMMGAHFYGSGETISRQFHACLLAILKLHVVLLKKPTPIQDDCDDERGARQPLTAEEYFNLRHAKARNVIERCFELLKGRWGILRSPSWFSLQTHGRIVLACALLHNLVKRYMLSEFDDDDLYEESSDSDRDNGDDSDDDDIEYITSIDVTNPWTNFRNTMAQTMFNDWRARKRGLTL